MDEEGGVVAPHLSGVAMEKPIKMPNSTFAAVASEEHRPVPMEHEWHASFGTVAPPAGAQAEVDLGELVGIKRSQSVTAAHGMARRSTHNRTPFQLRGFSRALSAMTNAEAEQNGLKSTLHSGPQGAHLIQRNCNEEVLAIMDADASNSACADCSAPLGTDAWAAVNHGIFICIRCCGVHRSLGTHISQCRSLDLDDWTAEHVSWMLGGNKASKAMLEAHIPRGYIPPSSRDPGSLCADWIQAKYMRKAFVRPLEQEPTLESYSLAAGKVQLMSHGRGRPAQARIVEGVVLVETSGWSPSNFMVALDTMAECGQRRDFAQAGPQDRPRDSKGVQVCSERGASLLELEVRTSAEVVAWLKALRGGAALGSRSAIRAGWLTTAVGRMRRKQKRWFVLHPSGLYFFKTEGVGSQLPQAAAIGSDWKGVLYKGAVQGLDWGDSKKDFWLSLRTSDGRETHLSTPEESCRGEWLKVLFDWVGWECRAPPGTSPPSTAEASKAAASAAPAKLLAPAPPAAAMWRSPSPSETE